MDGAVSSPVSHTEAPTETMPVPGAGQEEQKPMDTKPPVVQETAKSSEPRHKKDLLQYLDYHRQLLYHMAMVGIRKQHYKELVKGKEQREKQADSDFELALGNEHDDKTVPERTKARDRGVTLVELAAEFKLKELLRICADLLEKEEKLHTDLNALDPKYFVDLNWKRDIMSLIELTKALSDIWFLGLPDNATEEEKAERENLKTQLKAAAPRNKEGRFEHKMGVLECRINYTRSVITRILDKVLAFVDKLRSTSGLEVVELQPREIRELYHVVPTEYLFAGHAPVAEKTWQLLFRKTKSE